MQADLLTAERECVLACEHAVQRLAIIRSVFATVDMEAANAIGYSFRIPQYSGYYHMYDGETPYVNVDLHFRDSEPWRIQARAIAAVRRLFRIRSFTRGVVDYSGAIEYRGVSPHGYGVRLQVTGGGLPNGCKLVAKVKRVPGYETTVYETVCD